MKNTFGNNISLTLFGESHGEMIGAVLDGMAPGIPVDEDFIARQMALRRSVSALSTSRDEPDRVRIVSGVFEGKTTGTPMTFLIENTNTRSGDYAAMRYIARPGHADFTAEAKYHGYQDPRGGGHFSGRITAGLVAAGAVAITALKNKGITVGTHIASCAGIEDRAFADLAADIAILGDKEFAVLDPSAEDAMKAAIASAKQEGDSVGGVLETAVLGMPVGVGEPWFDTVESVLAHILFGIPAIKGVEFGRGFDLARMKGSEANDPFIARDGGIGTTTNNCGGILGGITNGMPVIVRCAVKPTPSIYKEQATVDFAKGENLPLVIHGRHDPAIVHRARVVVDSAVAIALCDLLVTRFGTDWLR